MDATLKTEAKASGVFTCMGCDGQGSCEISQVNFFVTTLPEGFQVTGPTRAVEGDTVDLLCAASRYNYTGEGLAWYKQTTRGYTEVTTINTFKRSRHRTGGRNRGKRDPAITVLDDTPSQFDIGKRLRFQSIEPEDSGVYVCQAKKTGPKRRHNVDSSTVVERKMELRVQGLKYPEFYDTTNMNKKDPIFIKDEGESVELRCKVRGYPTPRVQWFLNDTAIDFNSRHNFLTFDDGQSLRIAAVAAKNEGQYKCLATSRAGQAQLTQVIMKVQPPTIFKTDMFGSDQMIDNMVDKVVEDGSVMNLTCQTSGNPRPDIAWMFNNLPVNDSVVKYANHNQTMIIEKFSSGHEGKYDCIVTNLGGTAARYQWVKLRETEQRASIYGMDIAIPVFIAVGAVIVLAVICVAIAKVCLTTGRWNKAPPTPPTPRLTQFDLPDCEDQETESCRLTLSRDGSPNIYGQAVCHGCQGCSGTCHHCNQCHYNYNGLYGCTAPGMMAGYQGGSVLGVRSVHSPVPSVGRIPSPTTTLLGEYNTYGHYTGTLPPHRMDTLRREMSARFKESRRSASPRISAEF